VVVPTDLCSATAASASFCSCSGSGVEDVLEFAPLLYRAIPAELFVTLISGCCRRSQRQRRACALAAATLES
jgi:hypothetical protein